MMEGTKAETQRQSIPDLLKRPRELDDDSKNYGAQDVKHNRVRTGCFSCRKRKKKCDETLPVCKACLRNRIKCEFPKQANETLPEDFDLEVTTYEESSTKRSKGYGYAFTRHQQIINVNVKRPLNARKCSISNENSMVTVMDNETPVESKEVKQVVHIKEHIRDVKEEEIEEVNVQSHLSPTTDQLLLSFSKHIPNMVLTELDSHLYHNFVHQFIPSISLPHAHPLLAPKYIWVNLGQQSEILAQVYLFCGASYLTYQHQVNNKDLSSHYNEIACKKYRTVLNSLSGLIKELDIDSDWLVAAGLTLSLCDRTFAADSHRCAKHLVFVYSLVKRREDKLLAKKLHDLVQVNKIVTPNERSLFDSFAFNYSTLLFTCLQTDLLQLPLPFDFFPKIKQWFKVPTYADCDIPWMNNPVLGSSIESFEILLKLLWILRFHFDDVNVNNPTLYINNKTFWTLMPALKSLVSKAQEKIEIFKHELDSSYIDPVHSYDVTYQDLRSNLAVSTIILLCCEILCEKLMNPSIPSYLPTIQRAVDLIIIEFVEKLQPLSRSNCLTTLGFFFAGISTSTEEQREKFLNKLTLVSDTLNFSVAKNIITLLKANWAKEKEEEAFGDFGFRCFDLIFDREAVGLMVL